MPLLVGGGGCGDMGKGLIATSFFQFLLKRNQNKMYGENQFIDFVNYYKAEKY